MKLPPLGPARATASHRSPSRGVHVRTRSVNAESSASAVSGARRCRQDVDRDAFPCLVARPVHQQAGSKQRRERLPRVQAFERDVTDERRRGQDDLEARVRVERQPGDGRAVVGQRHRDSVGLDQAAPREVLAGRRKSAVTERPLNCAEAASPLVEHARAGRCRPRNRPGAWRQVRRFQEGRGVPKPIRTECQPARDDGVPQRSEPIGLHVDRPAGRAAGSGVVAQETGLQGQQKTGRVEIGAILRSAILRTGDRAIVRGRLHAATSDRLRRARSAP